MMKKLLAILLSLTLFSFALCGCGKKADNTPQSTAAPEKTVITLTAMRSYSGFEAGFEAAYPQYDLQVETLASGVINGEIIRRLKNNHASDLFVSILPSGEVAAYTCDLSAESFVEKYQTTIRKSIALNGQDHFLPLPGSYQGYIINKTLLDELGLSLPATTADLLSILAAAKEKNIGVSAEGYGFGLSDVGASFLGAYYTADFAANYLSTMQGASWLNAIESKTASFSGNWEGCASFLKACIGNGYVNVDKIMVNYNGTIDSNATSFKAEEQLPARTAIVTYGDLAMYDLICSRTEDEIVMLPVLPEDENGNTLLSAVSNDYIAINSAIESDPVKYQAATAVLSYLSTEEGQRLWMEDSSSPYSYLTGVKPDTDSLPENLRTYVDNEMVFSNPFPTNLLSYIGKQVTDALKDRTTMAEALSKIDDYYRNGSEDVDYDMSVVGTVVSDMLYANANTRVQETEIGNFVSDAIREYTGADVALVNGGSIRSSLYAGDVTGQDLAAVCPYGNLVIVAEMDGATLRAAITNGIQKTWKPAGQFLQVSGIKYSFRPAANQDETAELVSLCYADGREVGDSDVLKVAYTNYMGGSSGYVDAGDGYTMLNVYDDATPKTVKLLTETGKTFGDILKVYFANHISDQLSGVLEGRITVIQ